MKFALIAILALSTAACDRENPYEKLNRVNAEAFRVRDEADARRDAAYEATATRMAIEENNRLLRLHLRR